MANVSALLAQSLDQLDLAEALENFASNDLLPERIEDGIVSELPPGWVASLRERIRTGMYRPHQVEVVYTPKTRFATRPAALAILEDRVVFEALTAALREPVEASLVSPDYLYWPRGVRSPKRWPEFKRKPVQNEQNSHIVIGDVAGFYESVDHVLLQESILSVTGWPDLSAGISAFLSEFMGRRRGLPQGLAASDVLATLYLATVDGELAGHGLQYTRHGDDIRIATQSYAAALAAAHHFEVAVRKKEIFANDSKLGIRLRDNYIADLDDVDNAVESLKGAWAKSVVESLAEVDDRSEAADLISQISEDNPEFEEVGWEWYHGDLSQDELIELIRPYLSPAVERVAEQLLRDTFALRPGGNKDRAEQLPQDRFSDRFTLALATLRAAGNPVGIDFCKTVLLDYPEQSENVCKYLISVAAVAGAHVAHVCTEVLQSDVVILDWQVTWIFRTLSVVPIEFVDGAKWHALRIVTSDSFGTLARVEAAKFLASCGNLFLQHFQNLWRGAPPVYRPDLIQAAAIASKHQASFVGPLQLSKADTILRIIVNKLTG